MATGEFIVTWTNERFEAAQNPNSALRVRRDTAGNIYIFYDVFGSGEPLYVSFLKEGSTSSSSVETSYFFVDEDSGTEVDITDGGSFTIAPVSGNTFKENYKIKVVAVYDDNNKYENYIYFYIDVFAVAWGTTLRENAQKKENALKVQKNDSYMYQIADLIGDGDIATMTYFDIGSTIQLNVSYTINKEGETETHAISSSADFVNLDGDGYYVITATGTSDNITKTSSIYVQIDNFFNVVWHNEYIQNAQNKDNAIEVQTITSSYYDFDDFFGTVSPVEVSEISASSSLNLSYKLIGDSVNKQIFSDERFEAPDAEYMVRAYGSYNNIRIAFYINVKIEDFFNVIWEDEYLNSAIDIDNAIKIQQHENGLYYLVDFLGSQNAITVTNSKKSFNSAEPLELKYYFYIDEFDNNRREVNFSDAITWAGTSENYDKDIFIKVETSAGDDTWSRKIYLDINDFYGSEISNPSFGSSTIISAQNKDNAIKVNSSKSWYNINDFLDDNNITVTIGGNVITCSYLFKPENDGNFENISTDDGVTIEENGYYLLRAFARSNGVYFSAYIYFHVIDFFTPVWINDTVEAAQEQEKALKIAKTNDNIYTFKYFFDKNSVNDYVHPLYLTHYSGVLIPIDEYFMHYFDDEILEEFDSVQVFYDKNIELTKTGYYVLACSTTYEEERFYTRLYIYIDENENFFDVTWGSDTIEKSQAKETAIKIIETEDKKYNLEDFFGDVQPITIKSSGINDEEVQTLDVTYTITEDGSSESTTISSDEDFDLNPNTYYILNMSASYDGVTCSKSIYLFVKGKLKITLKQSKWKNSETPADLGHRFEYLKKSDFLHNFLVLDPEVEDANINYIINKYPNSNMDVEQEETVKDIYGVGFYSIDISCDNYVLLEGSDVYFYGVVESINSLIVKIKEEFENMSSKNSPLFTTLENYKTKDEFVESYLDIIPENISDEVSIHFTIEKFSSFDFTDGELVDDIDGVGYYEILIFSDSHYILDEFSDTVFYIEVDKVTPLIKFQSENIKLYYTGTSYNVADYVTVEPSTLTVDLNLSNVTDVGKYNIIAKTEETDYYNEAEASFYIEIIKRTPTITVEDEINLFYTSEYYDVEQYVEISDGVEYFFNLKNIKEVGSYEIIVQTVENSFYYAIEKTFKVNIIKRTPAITLNEQNIKIYYDGMEHDITGYASVSPDTLALNFSVESVTSVGNYEIIVSVVENEFYYGVQEILYVDVIKRTPTISLSVNSITLNYNGNKQDVTGMVSVTTNPEDLTVKFSRKNVQFSGSYNIEVYTVETDYYYSAVKNLKVDVVRSPNLLEHDDVLNMIKNSLMQVMDEDYYYYKDYKVVLAKEQEFIKLKQAEPKTIYIVIKFGSASINFSQTVLPVTLTAMSEQNKLDMCHKLLSDFVNKYNLSTNEDSTIRQVYELPVVTSNFNKVFEGFRSVLFVNGYFVISKDALFYSLQSCKKDLYVEYNTDYINDVKIDNDKFLEKVKDEIGVYNFSFNESWFLNGKEINSLNDYGINIEAETVSTLTDIMIMVSEVWEDVPLLTFNLNLDLQLDSQPFFNRNNFTESRTKYGVLSFSINTFLLDNVDIINKAVMIALKRGNIDEIFKLRIILKNGVTLEDNFKLLSVNTQQEIAQIPAISLGFTN